MSCTRSNSSRIEANIELQHTSESGKEATQRARDLWWRRPSITLGKFIAETLTTALIIASLTFVIAPPILAVFLSPPDSIASLLATITSTITSTTYLRGLIWMIFALVGLSWSLGAWTDSAIWSLYQEDIDPQNKKKEISWLQGANQYFAKALSWRALRSLMRTGLLVLYGMMYVSLLLLQDPARGFGVTFAAFTIAFLYAGALLFGALVTIAIEMAPAYMVMKKASLGEALLQGAHTSIEHLAAVYRLFATSVAIVIVPAILFWLFEFTVGRVISSEPYTQAVLLSMRATLNLFLLAGVSAFLVLFRGGSFFLAASHAKIIPPLGAEKQTKAMMEKKRASRENISLGDFLPAQSPNIISVSSILQNTSSQPASSEEE